jgi:transcriptional regulator with XRE-family HTH domain
MFGDFLRDKRNEKGLTLVEASKLSGVAYSTLQLIEVGKKKPRFLTLRKLSGVYGVSYEKLLKELNKKEK